jgi:REP element-mobilizing transposase RayT
MILAYHSIFSMYGFWMPNDPRGSGSDYIAVWNLFRYGPATKTDSRRSVAAAPHDRAARLAAKQVLRYPPVQLTGVQAITVVDAVRIACVEASYSIHACSILPDHVHLVVGRHQRDIRQIVGHLKSRATRLLKERGQWPADGRPVWGAHGWNVFLDDLTAVNRAMRYVGQNPVKEGKKPQRWSIVTPFDLSASQATRRNPQKRRIGGAALRSAELKRHREGRDP